MEQTPCLDFGTMRGIDIRSVEPSTLVDIEETQVNPDKPLPERMLDYIRQIRNPYCFRCGKTIVRVSFADTKTTIEERMEGYFRSL